MVHNNGPKVKIDFGAKYTSEYKQAKPKSDGLVTLPIIHPHKLDDLVYSIPSKRLLTVCLISDKYSESRPGMKMLRWAASKMWRHEKKQLILRLWTKLIQKPNYYWLKTDCKLCYRTLFQKALLAVEELQKHLSSEEKPLYNQIILQAN